MGDVMGFSNIVNNSDSNELTERIEGWVNLVINLAEKHKLERIQLLSDTVFIGTGESSGDLAALIQFSQELLSVGVRNSYPIRGAITYGEYEWGKLTYGKTVIRSHVLEANQNWIGVTCDNNLPHAKDYYDLDYIVCYTPPLKSGPITIHAVVAWDVPDFKELMKLLCSNGLTHAGEYIAWNFAEKLKNTIEFRNYMRFMRHGNVSPKTFHGNLPIEIISMNLPVA